MVARSDARENRARILQTARVALAEDGATSTNQIAQLAGVGPGTLYRHFPTRESLVLAVYEHEVDHIVESVPQLLARESPLDALRAWTVELVGAMRRKHGLGDALSPSGQRSATERTYGTVLDAITAMFEAGKRDGSIRGDAHPGDFLQLTTALWRAAPGPKDRSPFMLELILDGLRAAPPDPTASSATTGTSS